MDLPPTVVTPHTVFVMESHFDSEAEKYCDDTPEGMLLFPAVPKL